MGAFPIRDSLHSILSTPGLLLDDDDDDDGAEPLKLSFKPLLVGSAALLDDVEPLLINLNGNTVDTCELLHIAPPCNGLLLLLLHAIIVAAPASSTAAIAMRSVQLPLSLSEST